MLIIPAVDIKGGKCVRLIHGDPHRQTVYSEDPVEMARFWVSQGAARLHVVDLDGALGTGSNLELLRSIRTAVPPSCQIQVGGGLRSLEAVARLLDEGIDFVVLGTSLLENSDWVAQAVNRFSGRLMAAVDVWEGEVKVKGWQKGSGQAVPLVLRKIEAMGFSAVIFTDISRDGTLMGPAITSTKEVLGMTRMSVYASGGITSVQDILSLKVLEPEGLEGGVVGKALYDGRLSFTAALDAAK